MQIEGYRPILQYVVDLTGFKIAHIVTFIILIAVICVLIYQYKLITRLTQRCKHIEVQSSVLRRELDDVKASIATLTAPKIAEEQPEEQPKKRRGRRKKSETEPSTVAETVEPTTVTESAEEAQPTEAPNEEKPKRITKKALKEAQMEEAIQNGEKLKAAEPDEFGW